MNMHNMIKRLGWIGALLAFSMGMQSTARADDFYIGAGAYNADVESGSFDDEDTVSAFTLGYFLVDSSVFMLSAELSRYDLGSYRGPGFDIETEATSLAAVAYLPLGPFIEVYAKAGIASVDIDINNRSSDDSESFRGIGIGFDLFDTVDLFAEYLVFDTDLDSELVGIGIRLDF